MFWNRQKTHKLDSLSPDIIKQFINHLQLPPIIMDLFNGTCSDERVIRLLGNQYQAPFCLLDIPLNNAIKYYSVDRYLPFLAIWQSVILAYDLIKKDFVRYSIEHFEEENLLHMTWNHLLFDEITQWRELEIQDADLIYLGNLFGLKNTESLIEKIIHNNI